MKKLDIIIIGGGLSGLSAAVELCARGHKILLLEQHPYCGGRTRSFIEATTGDMVDNGQHLMMGCYYATRRFMRIIGSEYLTYLQPSLIIPYLHPSLKPFSFECPRLRAPFHMLGGILGFHAIPLRNRMEILTLAKELIHTSPAKEKKLDEYSVEEWLMQSGQSASIRKYLWDVITIGALNDHPKHVSALMLFRVLRSAFLGKREHSSLLLPRSGLSDLFVAPAIEFIRRNGGDVLMQKEVSGITILNEKMDSVITQDQIKYQAAFYISAVPWYELDRLLHKNGIRSELVLQTPSRELCDLERFKPSPIISIQLWFDRVVLEEEFAALIDTTIQWVFNKTSRTKTAGLGAQHLSLVMSGAHKFIDMDKKELVALALKDLSRVLPKVREASLVHSFVLKEKRATFSPIPKLNSIRPLQNTSIPNFFLAGDWTNTGFPATIEGAIGSGKEAAELICRVGKTE